MQEQYITPQVEELAVNQITESGDANASETIGGALLGS
jgi:hypothetical protein